MAEGSSASAFTADLVAEMIRRDVLAGKLGADDRIKDQELMARFDISRSTAREAIRQVASDGLVVLRLHSGAAVRRLEMDDVQDIYRVRRSVEYSAVMNSSRATQVLFDGIAEAVAVAEGYVERQMWPQAVTASLDVHVAVVGLLESPRLSKFFTQQLVQLRVAFWALPMESNVQAQWISRDHEISDLLLRGRRDRAGSELLHYLDDSEATVLDAFRALELSTASTPV